MDELASAKWFSKLDLKSGYHQNLLKPGKEHKTAFETERPFWLTGAPATFMAARNETLAPVLRKCALVFFDDILIYNSSWEDHLVHLKQLLHLLAKDQWKVNIKKWEFAQTKIAYLGHVLSEEGISIDPAKIEIIRNWPTPKDIKELRSFLELAG